MDPEGASVSEDMQEEPLGEGLAGLASPWLDWARRLDAMARIGSTFAGNPYESRRYAELAVIAKEMFASLSGRLPDEIPDLYLPTEGYVTPKVDVRAAVFDDEGRVLLV